MAGFYAELAAAKINLTLHVTGRRADGYHLLDSLVVFPQVGDRLEAEAAPGLSLSITGPFAGDLGTGSDNLVLRAAMLLRPANRGAAIRLKKVLPVASGIGGGSADAAAALRLLTRIWDLPLPPVATVLELGADVPVCLQSRACRMTGIGEGLTHLDLPPFWLVLANPGVPIATASVFRSLGLHDGAPMPTLPAFADADDFAVFLELQRNDLEAAAIAEVPRLTAVLGALAAQPGCRVARMSGSGATCYGFFASANRALAAADRLRTAEPGWWVTSAPVSRPTPGGIPQNPPGPSTGA